MVPWLMETFHSRGSARKQSIKDLMDLLGPPGSDPLYSTVICGLRQSPNVAFRGELEGKREWADDEPLIYNCVPARSIRLKPSQW